LGGVFAEEKDMDNDDDRKDGETLPKAKRTGREGVDPESMPAEYVDDMRVNRSTPPPEPDEEK
jgi:hypothetical protein